MTNLQPGSISPEIEICIGILLGWAIGLLTQYIMMTKKLSDIRREKLKQKVRIYNEKLNHMDYATRFIKKADIDRFLDLASLDLFKETCKAALFEQYLDFFLILYSVDDRDDRKINLIFCYADMSGEMTEIIREGFDEIYPTIEKKLPNKYFKRITDNMNEAEAIEKDAKEVLDTVYGGDDQDEDPDADPELHPREDVAETTTDESYASIEDIAKYNTVEDEE